MNILLINPSQEKVYGIKLFPVYPPLGLLYIGAALRKSGHSVKLLDIDIEKVTPSSFRELLTIFQPKVIGITSVTPTINDALRWAHEAKKFDRSIKVVMGGIHVTVVPCDIAKEEAVDFVVVGEGEKTAVELMKAIEEGSVYSNIDGVVYKDGRDIKRNRPRELVQNIDEIDFPAMDLLVSLNKYIPPDSVRIPVASIMTSRGCPGDCTFCCTKLLFTRHVRLRSVDNIIKEIDLLVQRYGVKEIHIADDTFTIDKKRVLDFCEAVRKKRYDIDFEFLNGLRADFIDEDILKVLKSIKMRNLGFGVESGSEEVLAMAKKNISLEKVRNAFRLAKKFNFESWAFFIIGLPGETTETIKKTLDFAKELDPDFVKFLTLKPYPGTEVFYYLSERSLIDDYDFDKYGVYTNPVHHLPGLSMDDMVRWQKFAYISFYFRPLKLLRHVTRIRSSAQLRTAFRGLKFIMFNILKKSP